MNANAFRHFCDYHFTENRNEPAHHIVQLGGQRFSASELFDHFHDDHEPDMCTWLARVEKQ